MEQGEVWGLWEDVQVGNLRRQVVDLSREVLEGSRDVDA